MISCTDFIPAYNELFAYLDDQYGFEEVQRYWDDIFDPSKDGLLNRHVQQNGLRGCYEYWAGSLNEEAADFRMMLNEQDGWFMIEMRHCPSKGRLLETPHIKPYDKYCLHCDLYRKTIESHGLRYDYDFTDVDRAACRLLVTDPNRYQGKRIITPDTLVMDRKANDNRYLHQEFHTFLNMSLNYVGSRWGEDALNEYLLRYTRTCYAPVIARVKEEGWTPLADAIRKMYEKEGASELLHMEQRSDMLKVSVDACPAVMYLRKRGLAPSRWFEMTTSTIMNGIAEMAGLHFTMNHYRKEDGATEYTFSAT